jgi:hypothetical protein
VLYILQSDSVSLFVMHCSSQLQPAVLDMQFPLPFQYVANVTNHTFFPSYIIVLVICEYLLNYAPDQHQILTIHREDTRV